MKRILFLLILFSAIISCGKGKETITPPPTAANLSSPINNEACNTGVVVSDSESQITFKWQAGTNVNTYVLTVTNLLTKEQVIQTVSSTSTEITLKRNTPYSWLVTSKSNKNTATADSEKWKFYNAGLANSSYAPYPAEIINPKLGQIITPNNGKITLEWKGADADNDIKNYDIYLGNTKTPLLIKGEHASSTLADVSVNGNTTYYWKVITRDSKGNTSDSGLFEFKTK